MLLRLLRLAFPLLFIAANPAAVMWAASSEAVTIGVYLDHVPDLDLKTNSYVADFYIWFLWKGDIDPTQSVEFTNVLNPQELSKVAANVDNGGNAKPEILPDGRRYQSYHVQGTFWHPFPVGDYPFDEQDIVLLIEDAKHSSNELTYEVDSKETAMRPGMAIPGWNLGSIGAKVSSVHFPTNFGDTRVSSGMDTYSHVEFRVHVTRPRAGLILKTLVPISIIILITFGALFCKPQDIDARLCLTITALISAVALQYTTSTELPPTGYLLLIDKVYLLSYVVILVTTFLSIFANRLESAGSPDGARRLDRQGLMGLTVLFFGGTIFLALSR
jgi:hypothetical protein